MTTQPLRVPAIGSFLFAAIGVWIVLAPTAVGYQPATEAWTGATANDVFVGAGLIVVSLGLLVAQLTAGVRTRLAAHTARD